MFSMYMSSTDALYIHSFTLYMQLFLYHKIIFYPAGKITRILGGGESLEKFGLSVKRESTGKVRGNLGRDSSQILPRFPEEFVGISYGFIGDKTVANFKGNPLRFSGEFM